MPEPSEAGQNVPQASSFDEAVRKIASMKRERSRSPAKSSSVSKIAPSKKPKAVVRPKPTVGDKIAKPSINPKVPRSKFKASLKLSPW